MVLAALSLSLGATSIPFGQVVPFALAAICASALFASTGRWRAASITAAVAMIEPHLGLPVCMALAVWAPATRVTLVLSFTVLAMLSLAMLGVAANVEYVVRVLPAQALSEAANDMQYSLTSVLASAGAADTVAVRAGSFWYLVLIVTAVFVAGALAKKTGNVAFLACVPPAFAVFGGAYICAFHGRSQPPFSTDRKSAVDAVISLDWNQHRSIGYPRLATAKPVGDNVALIVMHYVLCACAYTRGRTSQMLFGVS